MNKHKIKKIFLTVIIITIIAAIKVYSQIESPLGEEAMKLKQSLKLDQWPGKNEVCRYGINLSVLNVPGLSNAEEKKPIDPYYVSKKIDGEFVANFRSRWYLTSNSFVEITLSFYQSGNEAHENFIPRYMHNPLPLETRLKSRDEKSVAGDVSFYNGQLFIRDNIIVHINAEGEMNKITKELAVAIDSLLLCQPIVPSKGKQTPRVEMQGNKPIIIKP